MRADYVDRFQRTWTRGLRRLVDEGAWFPNAAYPYLTTVTCAGHATIATGALPPTHGVFQNAWYDRTEHRLVTCTEDPAVQTVRYAGPSTLVGAGPSTTLRAGNSGVRLVVPTLADALRQQRGGRVATVSLKARSAIMLAGHGGDAVTWLNESLDRWETSTAFSAAPVPAVRRFLQGNTFDGDFGAVWTRLLPPKAYAGPDAAPGEAPPNGWTSTFPHVLAGTTGVPDRNFREQWVRSPFANAYLGRFAASVAESLQMGRRTAIDFLGIGFSSPDLIGHAFGPRSHEVQDVYARLDGTIGDLFDRLDRLAGRGRWIVALTGDHGVTGLPEQAPLPWTSTGRVDTRRLTDTLELKVQATLGPGTSVSYVARVNGNDVYFAPGVYDRLAEASALEDVVRLMEAQPGIARVFRRDELARAAGAHDPMLKAAALSYVPDLSGDLVMALRPGWTFAAAGTGHGTGNPDDQRVPILMMGPDIRSGRYRKAVTPADIAPTLAALCGVTLQRAEGHILNSVRHP